MEWYRKTARVRVVWVAVVFAAIAWVMVSRGSTGAPPAKPPTKPAVQWRVYFSPNGGATDAIVGAIGAAKKGVLVQAYSFTSQPIARALLNAKKRGVGVKIILDRGQVTSKYSSADFFRNVGMIPWIDSRHAIAHNKVMVIDGTTVITGSFNFTKAAEQRNAENLLIIRDSKLAAVYAKNWEAHRKHSEIYKGKDSTRKHGKQRPVGTRAGGRGRELRRPVADYLRDGIFELRIKYYRENYRILYFYCDDTVAALAHGLAKESDVPDKDINLAVERKRRFEENPEGHTYED